MQYEVTCPACGQTTVFEEDDLLDGAPKCPGDVYKRQVLESSMYNAREASVKLAEATGADCVQVIGSKFVLYLQKDVYKRQPTACAFPMRRSPLQRSILRTLTANSISAPTSAPGRPRCV